MRTLHSPSSSPAPSGTAVLTADHRASSEGDAPGPPPTGRLRQLARQVLAAGTCSVRLPDNGGPDELVLRIHHDIEDFEQATTVVRIPWRLGHRH